MGSSLFSSKGKELKAFTLFEGVLMLVLGVLALIFPVLASAWITVIVALGFLVGGIVGWVSNLARRFASLSVTFNWCRDRIGHFFCLRPLSG